jgi:hypothetical protein
MDQNIDFKFKENQNTTVFTCQKIIDGADILNVFHNHDGSWEFYTNSDADSNTKLVSLLQMTQLDPSLNELSEMDYGVVALRKNKTAAWEFETLEDEDDEGDDDE